MKKILLFGLLITSLNVTAFLDFNSYGSGYKNNDWPVWTPMHWMENNNSSNNRHYNYPYPYNNQAFNTNASRFNMNQMPMPNHTY